MTRFLTLVLLTSLFNLVPFLWLWMAKFTGVSAMVNLLLRLGLTLLLLANMLVISVFGMHWLTGIALPVN